MYLWWDCIMLCSMTGYGKSQKSLSGLSITVELKSVNSRYFEFNCRLPRGYLFLEDKLKSLLQSRVSRGKIEMHVSIESEGQNDILVTLNKGYLDSYMNALKELSKTYKVKGNVSASDFIGNSDAFIISRNQIDEHATTESVLSVADDAISNFISMRHTEGIKLSEDVKSRVSFILEKVAFIDEKSPETVKAYRDKLESKIRELIDDAQVDENRLITETAIFADKVAVAEETVRLRSHIEQLCNMLDSGEAVGRKLDFIVQEMNRETNTIGSKAQNIEIAQTVVDIKSEIEKIREQIQNIE